jgi:hypothetical protein
MAAVPVLFGSQEEINFESGSEAEFEIRNILDQNIVSGKTEACVNKLSISALNPSFYSFTLKKRKFILHCQIYKGIVHKQKSLHVFVKAFHEIFYKLNLV